MWVTIIALIVLAATAELAPIPLPGPPDCAVSPGVIHLDARRYVQEGERIGSGCTFIGQPGTTIVGGLRWSSGFPRLGGSIHFDGGAISSPDSQGSFSGENMSIVGCGLQFGMDVRFSGHVEITSSWVEVSYLRGVWIQDATIRLTSTSFGGRDDGWFMISNSTATMVDTKVSQIVSATFMDSLLSVEGLQSSFHGQQNAGGPFLVEFVNTSATFQHSTDVITSDDGRDKGVSVQASNHSSVTFRNCTSLARAIHNTTTKGDVHATADSLISCTPGESLLVV